MPLITEIKAGETLTVDGVRLAFDRKVKLSILDEAEIIHPNGRITFPRNEPTQAEEPAR